MLAVTLPSHGARALARAASGVAATPESRLVEAAAVRFLREVAPGAGGAGDAGGAGGAGGAAIEWSTSIPRGVGMGGSSAIVIATLRALAQLHGVEVGRSELAELALAVETEELGIAAGLQDRVAQSYGGLTFMDFGAVTAAERYEKLDPGLLPPLVIGWRTDSGGHSGAVHSGLRERFERGEGLVSECMAELGGLARRARDAVLAGDTSELIRCVAQSFDARQRMLELDPRHVEMVCCARASGAGANYAGSGGAIVAVCPDEPARERVSRELRRLGCGTTSV